MKKIIVFWTLALIAKLVAAYFLPLVSDEAYYWVWSHHLQMSYFDHPPFVAWLFRAGRIFEGFGHSVRWPAVLLGHLTLLVWWLILRNFINTERITWWMELMLFSPLVGYGSIVVTPDVPLTFFWSLGIYTSLQAYRKGHLLWYLGLGACLGLGFCSKYHVVIFVPTLLTWLTFSKKWSHIHLLKVLSTVGVGLIFSTPVLWWNYKNDFVSFLFQLRHGLGAKEWSAWWVLEYAGAQLLLLFPVVVVMALRRAQSVSKALKELDVLYYFAWGPLFFFFFTSFRGYVEANWPIVAYPAVFALCSIKTKSIHWIRVTTIFWITAVTIITTQVLLEWLPVDNRLLKTKEFHEFRPVAMVAQEYSPLFASSYQMASQLSYDLKRPIYKLKGVNRIDFYDFREESLPKERVFFLVIEVGDSVGGVLSQMGFSIVETKSIDTRFQILKVSKI